MFAFSPLEILVNGVVVQNVQAKIDALVKTGQSIDYQITNADTFTKVATAFAKANIGLTSLEAVSTLGTRFAATIDNNTLKAAFVTGQLTAQGQMFAFSPLEILVNGVVVQNVQAKIDALVKTGQSIDYQITNADTFTKVATAFAKANIGLTSLEAVSTLGTRFAATIDNNTLKAAFVTGQLTAQGQMFAFSPLEILVNGVVVQNVQAKIDALVKTGQSIDYQITNADTFTKVATAFAKANIGLTSLEAVSTLGTRFAATIDNNTLKAAFVTGQLTAQGQMFAFSPLEIFVNGVVVQNVQAKIDALVKTGQSIDYQITNADTFTKVATAFAKANIGLTSLEAVST